jgi:hypothetical protein
MTFEELCRLEPKLGELLQEARSHKPQGRSFCANAVWYSYGQYRHRGLKSRLRRLVGFERRERHAILSTPAAYSLAYQTIYRALPDCRRCSCA